MSESQRFIPLSLLAATLLWGSGCDTLKARKLAQDGVALYKDGEIPKAAALFDQAVGIDGNIPAIHINRGYTHMLLFQQDPKGKAGQQSAGIAIDSFKKYLTMEISQQQQARARDYLLQTLADAKRYDEAVEFFKAPLARTPPDVEALTILANIAKSLGKMDEARKWLQKRVDSYPKDADGFVALAVMDWDDLCNDSDCRKPPDQKAPTSFSLPDPKRIEIADHGIALLKSAVALEPTKPSPLIFWGLLLRERQYAYKPAFTNPKNPADPKALAELERVNKLKDADLAEAKELSQKAVNLTKAAGGGKTEPPKTDAAKPDTKAEPAKGDAAKGSSDAGKAANPEKK